MRFDVMRWKAGTILLALGVLLGENAAAQTWPQRPVRSVAPYPLGGSTDVSARAISEPLAQALGQPVIVENRVGATGAIGTGDVAKAAPDGSRCWWQPIFTLP